MILAPTQEPSASEYPEMPFHVCYAGAILQECEVNAEDIKKIESNKVFTQNVRGKHINIMNRFLQELRP